MARWIGCGLVLVLSWTAPMLAGDWQTDPDEAQRLAVREGRDLFLLFTGTTWCGSCSAFEDQILSRPAFLSGSTAIVRVKLEYPIESDRLPPELRDAYLTWRDRYGICAYPTVILADPSGRPYAVMGFNDEAPLDFVRKLDHLRSVRVQRDEALDRAGRSQGMVRARALDEALTAVRGASDSLLAVYHGEMVVRFFRPQIDEVIALDPDNAGGLRDRYRGLLSTDDDQMRSRAFVDRLNQIAKEQGAKAALLHFDTELARLPPSDFRSHLIVNRIDFLEADQQFEAALACAETMAADMTRTGAERRNLRTHAATVLVRLGKIEQALTAFDQLVTEAGTDQLAAYQILRTKGNVLFAQRPTVAIQALADASRLVSRDSMNWLDVVIPRARFLVREHRYDEAIASLDDALTITTLSDLLRTLILAQKAMTLAQAGRRDAALTTAATATAALDKIQTVDDSSTIKFIRSMLQTARATTEAPRP